MPWNTIDFHGIANLDRSLADHLTRYLDEKESAVGFEIVQLVRAVYDRSDWPIAIPAPAGAVSLSESAESCARRIKEMLIQEALPVSFEEWNRKVIDKVNTLLWDYVEILESGVSELFVQLHQVSLEKWNPELFQVVSQIKVSLTHHIEDTIWAIRRLDEIFWEYRWRWEGLKAPSLVLFKKIFYHWNMLIDRSLLTNLDKSRKYLSFHYKKFSTRYREYLKLKLRAEQSSKKFAGYHVFNFQEEEVKGQLLEIYQLLKIWNLNLAAKALPKDILKSSMSHVISIHQAFELFKDYTQLIEKSIYGRSRIFKKLSHDLLFSEQGIEIQQDVINGYRAEIHTLWTMISRYREFLLMTDPNPYTRTRWGFSEWTVGPEPAKTKQLVGLEFKLEHLEQQINRLQTALAAGPNHTIQVGDIKGEVYKRLHEMSQPLISKNMMSVNVEWIIETLQQFNELGSFEQIAIDFVGDVLSKALRADWKYHVLFDFAAFEEIYKAHCGLVGDLEDHQHRARVRKFEKHINQLILWVKSRTINKHTNEIEQDTNDIKEGLQEYYAVTQRIFDQENLSKDAAIKFAGEVAHGLLEYRFMFGKFFYELRENEPDERSIRNRFLFVDQYFESIEGKLQAFHMKLH